MAPFTFLRNLAQKKTQDVDVNIIIRSVLLHGTERVVYHDGTSQYNRKGSGPAACGLVALNFVRVAFLKEQYGLRDEALLQDVLSRECAEVRQHPLTPCLKLSLISLGNHCSVRTMVRKPSFRAIRDRRHLSLPRIPENFEVEDYDIWSRSPRSPLL